jgi:aminopeptidase YwaD
MHPSDLDLSCLRRDTAALAAISPRLGGTPGEIEARNWVTGQFAEAGLARVHAQSIVYPRWIGSGELRLDGQPVEALALHGSGSTPPEGLTARLINLGGGTEADYAGQDRADLRGAAHLAEAGVIYRRRAILRASRAGAAGVILVNPIGTAIEAGTAQIFGKLPIFAVSRATGNTLREAARRGAPVSFKVKSHYVAGRSANIVGELPGQQRAYVQVAAHYDAWYAGAADNAAGVAVMLELARRWHRRDLPLTVRFVSFAAEEEGLMGSIYDVLSRAPQVKALCRGVVSPDIVGPRAGGLFVSGGPPAVRAMAAALPGEMGYTNASVHGYSQTTYGDHWPYTVIGIPGLMFSKMPYLQYHTPGDTPDQIDHEDLQWTGAIVGTLLERWMGLA